MRILLFKWVFLIPFLGILVGIHVGFVCGQCQRDQKSLLLQLKGSLKYNHSTSKRLELWNQSVDCCKWVGVKCDGGALGYVVGLNLSNEAISGGLENSTGIFDLQYLQDLDLSFNNFNTTLPSRFGNLTGLVSLNLSNSGFMGQIPMEISNLVRLVSLDLSVFYFSNDLSLKLENPNLGEIVHNFGQLRELRLDGVNISAKGDDWCQALSSSLPNLRVLSLSNCFLSGPIHPSLSSLQSLTEIWLTNNNLSTIVPDFFVKFSNLIVLKLESCGLNGKFPEGIFQLPTLQTLDLANNPLLEGNFPEFHQNLSLQTIILSSTKFSGKLPESMGSLERLSRIELTKCNFNGPIPNSMANLKQLVYLDFSQNKFTGLIPSFGFSKNLTYINLSYNNLTGGVSSAQWEDLQKLVYVDLRYNALTGSIPSSLFAITSLQRILLSFNQFEGQLPEFANPYLSSMDTLDLSSNKLEGSIPKSVFDLRRLNVLTLSSNKFNGTIQLDFLGKLSNLTALDLSYNNLMVEAGVSNSSSPSFPQIKTLKLASCNLGEFPDLSSQESLFALDLSNNKISRFVPSWVWQASSLEYLNLSVNRLVGLQEPNLVSLSTVSILDLSHNQIRGTISIPPQSATYVDYSNNEFSSSIPPGIGNNLIFTYFFSLAHNSLTGSIPPSICLASYLQVLDLSNNNLSGAIPVCLIARSDTLAVLNLRSNNFEGNIPDAFPWNRELRTLDLSGNQLEGKVPASLANCTGLMVLNLGNNQINDGFPCHLKNISGLRVIILRNNTFQGVIGCPKDNRTWQMLQILDIAANSFSGKLPERCLATWEAMMGNGSDTYDHLKFKPFRLNSELYYQDSVTVTSKGLEMELVKILSVFTSIDFSHNNFEGPIPEVMGQFKALYALNMSHNAFTGQIPSSFGNLSQLESLDLSANQLSGPIPQQLATLTFLSFLNLSYNRFVGKIPRSTQLQSFSASSFEGNEGLCGAPLSLSCKNTNASTNENQRHRRSEFDGVFIITGVGFGTGAGAVIVPLLLWKKANKWYDDWIDKILMMLLPLCGLRYYTRGDWRNQSANDSEEANDDDYEEDDEDNDNDDDGGGIGGRYCVYCTKLDIMRKRAIHDAKCTCYPLLPPLSSASSCVSSTCSSSS